MLINNSYTCLFVCFLLFAIGISSRSAVMETDGRVDRTVMETNFFGPVQLTRGLCIHISCWPHLTLFLLNTAILPAMLERGSGQIVVISSLQGKMGLPLRSSCMLY